MGKRVRGGFPKKKKEKLFPEWLELNKDEERGKKWVEKNK